MPFTGESSDSESDGGGEGNARSVSGARLEITERSSAAKSRGIIPTIINHPATPLLSRKKHPPCTLGQVQDGVEGYYDHSFAAYNPASPAFSSKSAAKKTESHLTKVSPQQHSLNNTNCNLTQNSNSPIETKSSSTFFHTNRNDLITSSVHSAKYSKESSTKTFGTSYLDIEMLVYRYYGHIITGQIELQFSNVACKFV